MQNEAVIGGKDSFLKSVEINLLAASPFTVSSRKRRHSAVSFNWLGHGSLTSIMMVQLHLPPLLLFAITSGNSFLLGAVQLNLLGLLIVQVAVTGGDMPFPFIERTALVQRQNNL